MSETTQTQETKRLLSIHFAEEYAVAGEDIVDRLIKSDEKIVVHNAGGGDNFDFAAIVIPIIDSAIKLIRFLFDIRKEIKSSPKKESVQQLVYQFVIDNEIKLPKEKIEELINAISNK